ncbi:MAG TPA: carbonic anhydrase [Thermoanaerobaculia bacterium]|nr:carbonic anhydrase [Thermoanaerobaculia bacterium]
MRRLFIITVLICSPLLAQQTTPPAAEPSITADQLWSALMTGNKVYVAGSITYSDLEAEREQLKDHQTPPITVLACSDSRVPPELIFNQSLGALFVVRTAGNVVDDFGLASIEFAIANGFTRLIDVLGHHDCGAVKASLGGADPQTPAMTQLATRIRASFAGIPYDSRDAANVKKATEANARASAAQLLAMSKLIRDSVLTDRVKIVPAYHDLGSGVVKAID